MFCWKSNVASFSPQNSEDSICTHKYVFYFNFLLLYVYIIVSIRTLQTLSVDFDIFKLIRKILLNCLRITAACVRWA